MKRKFICALSVALLSCGESVHGQENFFTHKIGQFELVLLGENQGNASRGILIGATDQMLEKYAPDGNIPNAVNAFLLRSGDRNILFDAGLGEKLIPNLSALGVSPGEVEAVFLTHMHGDHVGGLMKDGAAVFTGPTTVMVADEEADYWNALPNDNPGKKTIDLYGDRIVRVIPRPVTDEASPQLTAGGLGVGAIRAFGHTPGHTAYLIESEGEKLLIWGDLAHAMAIQMPEPQVAVTYDVDPQEAVKARIELLDYVSKNRIPVAGMHVPYPGMGYVEKEGAGYRFIPLTD